MSRLQPDLQKVNFYQPSFNGGINTSIPDTEIADNEAVNILNMAFDKSDNLIVRQGVSGFSSSSLWDSAIWDSSLWSETTYANRITSIHYFSNDSGFVGTLFTTGNQLFSRNQGGDATNITGALTLPPNNFWQWTTYNGIAIGVNKATTGDNPIKVSGSSPGTAAALGGTPPKGKYIEVWNSRVWIVDAQNPNTIKGSAVGNPEDWTTVGSAGTVAIDVNKNDGDLITGIKEFKGSLFIFKREKIYVLSSVTEPNTNPSGYRVDIFTKNIGCIAPYTIQPILDDILFLSNSGVTSLSAAQIAGDFSSSILSLKVNDISLIYKSVEEISAFVISDDNQYWLPILAENTPLGRDVTYVMDYRYAPQGNFRWTTFDGYTVGTCYTKWVNNLGNNEYLIGCIDRSAGAKYFIGTYRPKASLNLFKDGGTAFTKSVLTKRFTFDNLNRDRFREWTINMAMISNTVALTVDYYFNGNTDSDGNYGFNFTNPSLGSLYDVALYDQALYDVGTRVLNHYIRRAFKRNARGQKAITVQFRILNSQADQGYFLKSLRIERTPLTTKHTSTV